jgi:hypothetical protein
MFLDQTQIAAGSATTMIVVVRLGQRAGKTHAVGNVSLD